MNNKMIAAAAGILLLVVVGSGAFTFFDVDDCEWEVLEGENGETFDTIEEADQYAQNQYGNSLNEIGHAEFQVIDGVVHAKLEECGVQTGELP